MNTEVSQITTRSYMERQLIVISEKDFLKTQKEDELRLRAAEARANRSAWANKAYAIAKEGVKLYSQFTVYGLVREWNRSRGAGMPLMIISKQQAAALKLPVGHPRERVVYVGHPSDPSTYFPMATFHRHMFEDKFREAVSILMSLGATKIQATHIKGWSRDFASTLSATIPSKGTKVSIQASANAKSDAGILFSATLPGNGTPALPDNLIWYPHEPAWQMVADGRLIHGMNDFSMTLAYEDDYGINSQIKTSVLKTKLDIGGGFTGHESTIWKLEGEFAPRQFNAAVSAPA